MAKENYSGLTEQELNDRIRQEKELLVKMNLNHTVSPIENPSKIRSTRRLIAQLQTALTAVKQKNK
jgi:large subunit ribosomal protein L29